MGMCFLALGVLLGFFTSVMVFSPFVSVDLLCSVATSNRHSRGSVVPRLLIPHPHLDWPEAGSAALQEKEVAAFVNVEVFVEVFAHAIWIFVFWSVLVAELTAMV